MIFHAPLPGHQEGQSGTTNNESDQPSQDSPAISLLAINIKVCRILAILRKCSRIQPARANARAWSNAESSQVGAIGYLPEVAKLNELLVDVRSPRFRMPLGLPFFVSDGLVIYKGRHRCPFGKQSPSQRPRVAVHATPLRRSCSLAGAEVFSSRLSRELVRDLLPEAACHLR